MSSFRFLKGGDKLLTERCDWYAYTSQSENSDYDKSEGFASSPTSLRCLADEPSESWSLQFDNPKLRRRISLWLPVDCAVARRDKIVYDSKTYRVVDTRPWQGSFVALCESIKGRD